MSTADVARGRAAGVDWRETVASERLGLAVLGIASVAFAAIALHLTRGTTYYADEVDFLQSARLDPGSLLTSVNGHLMAIPRLAYAVSFDLFGVSYVPFRLIEIAGMVACSLLIFLWGRRRIGNVALAPALILLFWGSSYEITLSPIGIPNIWSIAAGLGALVALDGDTRRSDLWACALLTAAVLTHSVGIAFVVGVAVAVLLRDDRFRRAWIFLVPLLVYGAWFLAEPALGSEFSGVASSLDLGRLAGAPSFIGNSAAAVLAGIFGLNYDRSPGSFVPLNADPLIGWGIAAAALVALGIRLRRGPNPGSLWMCLALLVALWLAYSLVSSPGLVRTPEEGRYLYPGAVAVFLVAIEAVRGVRLPAGWLAGIAVVTAFSVAVGVAHHQQGSVWLRSHGDSGRGMFTALAIVRDRVDPGFVPTAGAGFLMRAFFQSGPYLDAVDSIGDPGYSIAELPGESEITRGSADITIASALGIRLEPAAEAECRGGERVVAGAPVTIRSPGAVVVASEESSVAIRRFAETYIPLGDVRRHRPALITIPADRSARPWTLAVTGRGGERVDVCVAPAGVG